MNSCPIVHLFPQGLNNLSLEGKKEFRGRILSCIDDAEDGTFSVVFLSRISLNKLYFYIDFI